MSASLNFAPQGLVSLSVPAQGRSQTCPAAPVVRAGPGQAQGNGKAEVCSFLLSLIHVSLYPRAQIWFLRFFCSRGPWSCVLALPEIDPMSLGPSNKFLQEIHLIGPVTESRE